MAKTRTETEHALNPELLEQLSTEPAPINLHLYQPPRLLTVTHQGRTRSVFDITGTKGQFPGFNHQITHESYFPLVRNRILADNNVNWDLFGITADWLEINYPNLIDEIRGQIEAGAKLPVGDTYLHIILPFLSHDHKNMLIQICKQVYDKGGGRIPKVFGYPSQLSIQTP